MYTNHVSLTILRYFFLIFLVIFKAEIFQGVSKYISAPKNKTLYEESTLLNTIMNHLSTTQSESDVNSFRQSYDRLVHCVS